LQAILGLASEDLDASNELKRTSFSKSKSTPASKPSGQKFRKKKVEVEDEI
jgi:hypothetical protein